MPSAAAHASEATPTFGAMSYAEQLAQGARYDAEREGSVDALIAYKDALEDTLEALEAALRERGLEIATLVGDV